MWEIPSGSELLDLFPVLKSGRAGQLFLEFIKDGLADNWDEFIYRGMESDTVRTCTFFPAAKCLSVIVSFNPTCKGFLKLGSHFFSGVYIL